MQKLLANWTDNHTDRKFSIVYPLMRKGTMLHKAYYDSALMAAKIAQSKKSNVQLMLEEEERIKQSKKNRNKEVHLVNPIDLIDPKTILDIVLLDSVYINNMYYRKQQMSEAAMKAVVEKTGGGAGKRAQLKKLVNSDCVCECVLHFVH